MTAISGVSLWELLRHLGRWLGNLRRAGETRKRESIAALRAVIVAARQTQVYMRQLEQSGRQDHIVEARLTELWTELGFRLGDLGLGQLAKRCDIKGNYWADPARFNPEFLHKADVGLARMEQLARQMVAEIEK